MRSRGRGHSHVGARSTGHSQTGARLEAGLDGLNHLFQRRAVLKMIGVPVLTNRRLETTRQLASSQTQYRFLIPVQPDHHAVKSAETHTGANLKFWQVIEDHDHQVGINHHVILLIFGHQVATVAIGPNWSGRMLDVLGDPGKTPDSSLEIAEKLAKRRRANLTVTDMDGW